LEALVRIPFSKRFGLCGTRKSRYKSASTSGGVPVDVGRLSGPVNIAKGDRT
jgi:hypothetical protein